MRSFATGVTLVTTSVGATDVAMTANSFLSISLDPLIVSLCARKDGRWARAARAGQHFVVNVLAEHHEEVARTFASSTRPDDDRPLLEKIAHYRCPHTGAVVLDDALATVHCRLLGMYDVGDHVAVLGNVVDATVNHEASPLLFLGGCYTRLGGAAAATCDTWSAIETRSQIRVAQ